VVAAGRIEALRSSQRIIHARIEVGKPEFEARIRHRKLHIQLGSDSYGRSRSKSSKSTTHHTSRRGPGPIRMRHRGSDERDCARFVA
jgi:hypothetical protein